MKLKKLTLFGFKSFADKTEILFDEGVTCVVGPNGCGKSNISDSIRWVLGERSAKMLRGASMEDVIFNGTEYRKPLNFAEVSLTIDNTDKTLPLEYAEVTITRRLYRNGDSEYLINKTPCRLKDIQDLILDTGIGTRQYSMIEQGKIDHLLRAEPEERRTLIEEAAGIAKFKTKKDEALRKLQRTEENLQRLNDIVGEVEKNIKYAERQAKKAEKYKVEFDHLKNLEIERVFLAKSLIRTKRDAVEIDQTNIAGQLAKAESIHHELRSQIAGLETSVNEIQNRFQIKELGRYQKAAQNEKNEQQLKFISDKKMENAQQRGELLQEQDHLEETLRKSEEKKSQLTLELQVASAHLPELSARISQADQQIANIDKRLNLLRQNLEQARNHFFDRSRESSNVRNQLERAKAFLDHYTEQKSRFETDLAKLRQSIEENLNAIKSTSDQIHSSRESAATATAQYESKSEQTRLKDAAIKGQIAELEKNKMMLGEIEAKLGILESLQDEDSQAFAHFAAEISEYSSFYSEVTSIVQVLPGYEKVFDVALKSFAHLLLVNNADSLRQIIQTLKQKGKSSSNTAFTLAANEDFVQQSPNALILHGFKPLLEFVTIAAVDQKSITRLLSRTFVCDEFPLESIGQWYQSAHGWTLISRDGFIMDPSGIVSSYQAERASQFGVSRKRELEDARHKKHTLQVEIQSLSERLITLENEFESAENELAEADQNRTTINYHTTTLDRDFNQLEQVRETLIQQEKILVSDFEDWNSRAEETRHVQSQAAHALTQLEAEERELQNQLRQIEVELLNGQKEKETGLVDRREVLSAYESSKQKEVHLREALLMVENHEKLDRDRLVFLEEGKRRLVERDQELLSEEQQVVELRAVIERELQEISVEIELIRKDKLEQEARLMDLRSRIETCNNEIKWLQEKQHALVIQIKDFEFEEKSLIERIEQKYRLVFADITPPATYTQTELTVLDEQIIDLQKRVDQLGTVNLLAIEEFEELKQRFDFMAGQRKDLEDAREQLLEAIRKINRTTKELFEETFENVQRKFSEYYQILFSGGEAKLVLLDEAHPLDSGVDIVVRPPGKKLQHISLLSGGEKALTAVALLFALFSIKPSPFCLLDEVDAPLDEANVDRFIKVTNSFIHLSQFIIITHNRKTIAMGNSLYGVTMQEAGVSKIVSVRVASDLPDLTPARKTPAAGHVPV